MNFIIVVLSIAVIVVILLTITNWGNKDLTTYKMNPKQSNRSSVGRALD